MLEKIGSKFNYKTFIGSSNNKNEACELCNQTFDWKHKQHQCKRCLRNVCYYCGPDKAIIPSYDLKIPHRICKNCKDDTKHQTQLMEIEKCKFGQLSAIGRRWAALAQGDDVVIQQIQEEYQKSITQILKNASNETKNQIQSNLLRYYKENKKSLNYSLYDWNYKVTQGESENQVLAKISNVLHCFFQSNPVKLTRNLVLITNYILYFCDEAIALSLLQFLHQKVLPTRFQYHKLESEDNKPIDQEVKFLMDCLTEQSKSSIDPLVKSKIKVFLDTYSSDILTNLMFNHIEFYVGYFLFNQLLINREFSIYEKFLANICFLSQKVIQDTPIDEIPIFIIKNIQLEQLTTFLQFEDQQKRKHRSSLTSKDQLTQQSQQIIQQQQQRLQQEQQQIQRITVQSNLLDNLLNSFIVLIKESQCEKIEQLLTDEKYSTNKVLIKELYQNIKSHLGRQENDSEFDYYNIGASRNSIKSDITDKPLNFKELLEKNILIKEQEESIQQQQQLPQKLIENPQQNQTDNFKADGNLQFQQQNQQHNQVTKQLEEKQEQILKLFEQKEESYRNQINNLHSVISNLKFEINNLQIQQQQLQKNRIEYEIQLKEKINSEYEQEVLKLTEERVQLLKKTSFLQKQNESFSFKIEEMNQEIFEQKNQLVELKKNLEEMSSLCARQNEQTEKLNKHIDDLNIQILGLKRKNFDQNSNQTQVQSNITKELQENNTQIRNNLLLKEKELFNLKQKFVEVNQLKIEYFNQMQNYERINKEINQTLKLQEGRDIYQLRIFYEEKISLLEKTHEEQMNRLLSQFQQNPPKEEEQKIQQQAFRESQPQQEKQIIEEQIKDQSIGQADDCTIF